MFITVYDVIYLRCLISNKQRKKENGQHGSDVLMPYTYVTTPYIGQLFSGLVRTVWLKDKVNHISFIS